MLEVYLKTPGILFTTNKDKIVRTPIKLYVQDNERSVYESLIRVSAISDYEINKTEEIPTPEKSQRLSMIKPNSAINVSYKIKQ